MMDITLDPTTQRMVAEAMLARGSRSADELVREALHALHARDQATAVELDDALDETDREMGVPWHQAKSELMARYNAHEV